MAKNLEPVLLELATLPREQMGPFLMLGLEKDASKDDIEAHWAERVKWARKGQFNVPLEDINWARELVTDTAKRPGADAASLNADTVDGSVARVTRRFGLTEGRAGPTNVRLSTLTRPQRQAGKPDLLQPDAAATSGWKA
ncbi:MAG: hypothetical protein HYS12_24780 [Planctomycetes bacterium]|nr:hypothetical protein [Planctomycetota bacterium]